jgi:hypothetical protein
MSTPSYSSVPQQDHVEDGSSTSSRSGRTSGVVIQAPNRWLTSRRSRKGKKDVGYAGQASWTSSIINLVNTSTYALNVMLEVYV